MVLFVVLALTLCVVLSQNVCSCLRRSPERQVLFEQSLNIPDLEDDWISAFLHRVRNSAGNRNYIKAERSFTIDYDHDTFLKDGKPFRYISGTIHSFRVPYQFWEDRLSKMKAAGVNALETYVEWNRHEPENGVFDFTGQNDIVQFLKTADSLGLPVILRLGPYIDAERDMGGFPYWLLTVDPNMKLRTKDPIYLQYVERYFGKLLPLIKPLLYSNGGPVITVQVENEYGSYSACDFEYTAYLRDLIRSHLGDDVVLFTTDGAGDGFLKCGKNEGVYTTVDFGPGSDVQSAFGSQRRHQLKGPYVNSEYYPGWLDLWGEAHANVDTNAVTRTLDEMLALNASVNIYVFHGGTSFGFQAGAEDGPFRACPTSYDYDAPLNEAGDPTPKYTAIRNLIGKYVPLPPGPVPQPAPKMETEKIAMKKVFSFGEALNTLAYRTVTAKYPLSFEDISHGYGIVAYQNTIEFHPTSPAQLKVPGLRDRGYIYVNDVYSGILSRTDSVYDTLISIRKGQTLTILVENQGRICYGDGIHDRKGIIQNVTLGGFTLTNWTILPLQEPSVEHLPAKRSHRYNADGVVRGLSVYYGEFIIPDAPLDTFLKLEGWTKGFVILNSVNLGRYWPVQGPQITLYSPSVYFKPYPEKNTIFVVEQEEAPCGANMDCSVQFVKTPEIDGPVPDTVSKK